MAEANVKPLIRLVDDEVDQLTALEMLLTGQGWDVAAYTGAREFLTSDMPSRPGCLILDVRMPGISGLELQDEMNRREYPLPIIFLTGHGDIEMAVHVVREGARDFLQKPVDPEKLLRLWLGWCRRTAIAAPCRSTKRPGRSAMHNLPTVSAT